MVSCFPLGSAGKHCHAPHPAAGCAAGWESHRASSFQGTHVSITLGGIAPLFSISGSLHSPCHSLEPPVTRVACQGLSQRPHPCVHSSTDTAHSTTLSRRAGLPGVAGTRLTSLRWVRRSRGGSDRAPS